MLQNFFHHVRSFFPGVVVSLSLSLTLGTAQVEASTREYTQYMSDYQHEAFAWDQSEDLSSKEIKKVKEGRPQLTKKTLSYKKINKTSNKLVKQSDQVLQKGYSTQYQVGDQVQAEEIQAYHDQNMFELQHWKKAPDQAVLLDTQARTRVDDSNGLPSHVHVTSDITYLNQVKVKEDATRALIQLRKEMYQMNVPFNGSTLQEVAKKYGYKDVESYAKGWSWDDDLEAISIQRAMESAYATGMTNHSRPGGLRTFTIEKIDNRDTAYSENLAENYTSMYDVIYYGGWGYEELPELIKTNGYINGKDPSLNGHLHVSLNPEYDTYGAALIYGPRGIQATGASGYKAYLEKGESGGLGLVGWYEIPYLTSDKKKVRYIPSTEREDPTRVVRMAPGKIVKRSLPGKGMNQVDRLSGSNRYQTAVALSKQAWSKAETVVLANGNKFTDSLTGAPLAALKDAPLLLTSQGELNKGVREELKRLKTTSVILLGGSESLSPAIEQELEDMGIDVQRIGGKNRYEQASLVAEEIIRLHPESKQAFYLASGENFSDALNIATTAAQQARPILLVGQDVNPFLERWLDSDAAFTIVGGPQTVSTAIEQEIEKTNAVSRMSGANRYAVNRNILKENKTPTHYYVVSGEHYSDALPAAVLANKKGSGILFVKNNNRANLRQQVQLILDQKVNKLTLIGGYRTLSRQTERMIRNPQKHLSELF